MTKIKDIFVKPIDRPVNGVVKVGAESEEIKKTELEEYVVTDKLKKDFTTFFDAYDKSIGQPTEEVGVWISGFFGTGKSHFLKMLSYLLDNDEVAGKRAIDYFLSDGKFDDDHLKNAIIKATSVPTDVELFNIDAKADANGSSKKDAITMVFLRVFNEKLGYSPIPVVANMERYLDNTGKYEDFQASYKEITGSEWVKTRQVYTVNLDNIKKALVNSGAMDEGNADKYVQSLLNDNFSINIDDFAKLVKDYLDKKGNDYHFVFLVDEIGQFIADNGNKMLNLQTIVERLGTVCEGRAWVIVTAQQQQDDIINRNDFSKIQGRFKTMITMTSSNASEVIRKRLLDKKDIYKDQLASIYDENSFTINNKINFDGGISQEKFDSAERFVQDYPFIPYQFSLLGQSLTIIRKRGANGKNMSDGERSLLASFQEAAVMYMDDDLTTLVPFSAFFPGIRNSLNHDHQVVFDNEKNDPVLNPDSKDFEDDFNAQVLAALFMVKYLPTVFKATLNNITTLMLDNINTDRQALTEKVKASLTLLEKRNYIQKKMDVYEFLTDSEQEINEEINSIDVDDHEIVKNIGEYLLTSGLIDAKYAYPNMNKQYIFEFNELIDGSQLNRPSSKLSIRIVSPLNEANEEDYANQFANDSEEGNSMIIVLKNDDQYVSNLRRILRIEKYANSTDNLNDPTKRTIIDVKINERRELEEGVHTRIKEDLIDANIYVMGNVLPSGNSFQARLADAKKQLIDNNYRYLHYIDSLKSEDDVVEVLSGKQTESLAPENTQAIESVIGFVKTNTSRMQSLSFKTLQDTYEDTPYGYADSDIAWLVAKAFIDGKLRLFFNNEQLTVEEAQDNPKRFSKYLLSGSSASKLTIKSVVVITDRQKRDAKEYVEDVLDKRLLISLDETSEKIASEIKARTQSVVNDLRYKQQQRYSTSVKYPGQKFLSKGIDLLTPITTMASERIFDYISKNLDRLCDWRDDIEENDVLAFYGDSEGTSKQQEIWNRAHKYLERFEAAQGFINNPELVNIAENLKDNLDSENLKRSIPELRELNPEFADLYSNEMDKLHDKVAEKSKQEQDRLSLRLQESHFDTNVEEDLEGKIINDFGFINKEAENLSESSDVNAYVRLYGLLGKVDSTSNSLQNQINYENKKRAAKLEEQKRQEQQNQHSDDHPSVEPVAPTPAPKSEKPEHKRIIIPQAYNITDLVKESEWKISSEEDIDRYLNELKQNLLAEKKKYDVLHIDFKD